MNFTPDESRLSNDIDATAIIPQPLELKKLDGFLKIDSTAGISYTDDRAGSAAKLIASQLRTATGYPLPVYSGTSGLLVFSIVNDE